jgi:hypothetical protein
LGRTVFCDGEVFGLQVRDRFALLVFDDHVHVYQVGIDLDDVVLLRAGGLLVLR